MFTVGMRVETKRPVRTPGFTLERGQQGIIVARVDSLGRELWHVKLDDGGAHVMLWPEELLHVMTGGD